MKGMKGIKGGTNLSSLSPLSSLSIPVLVCSCRGLVRGPLDRWASAWVYVPRQTARSAQRGLAERERRPGRRANRVAPGRRWGWEAL